MVQLTTEQRIFIVLKYNRNHNTTEAQHAFRGRFPDRAPAHKATILRNVKKYSRDSTKAILAGQEQHDRSKTLPLLGICRRKIHIPLLADGFSMYRIRAETKALIGGGGVYSYIRVLPDEFLLKSVVITVDFKRNSSGRTRIYEYAPPPPQLKL